MLRNFFKNKKLLIIIGAVLAAVILVCVLIGALGESDKKDTTDHTSDKDNLVSVLNENNTPEKDAAQTTTANPVEEPVKKVYKSGTLVNPLSNGNSGGQKQSKSSVKFQSLSTFVDGQMDVHGATQKNLMFYQKFSATEEKAKLIAEYAELLCQNGMNFKKADSYYAEYDRETFASWGFNYTGTASVKENCEITFVDDDKLCAISIYYVIEYGYVEGYINWSASLEAEDLGFRSGGKVQSIGPAGKSACAGLIRTSSGKYQTTDGRFSVGLNQGSIIIDNKKQSCTFTYEDTKSSDILKIKDADGIDFFRVFFSNSVPLKTGILYNHEDIATEYQWPLDSAPSSMSVETTEVYQYVNKKWLTPTHTNSPYEDLTFRVVYYNAEEEVAVFYIYTKILKETEIFCAVDLSKAIKPNQSSSGSSSSGGSGGGITPGVNSGSSKCRYCSGKGYTTCTTCNGKGYYVIRGSTPDYAGSGGSKNYTEVKECPSLHCQGGLKDCPHC